MKLTPVKKHRDDEGRHVRWLIRRDMDEIISIDRSHVWERWSEEQYLLKLRCRDCIGTVVEDHRGAVMAAMIYRLAKDGLIIDRICVHQDHMRSGYGSALVQKLIDKLSSQRRTSIVVDVPYANLPAQLFFQSQGFRATPLSDVICFEYTLPETV